MLKLILFNLERFRRHRSPAKRAILRASMASLQTVSVSIPPCGHLESEPVIKPVPKRADASGRRCVDKLVYEPGIVAKVPEMAGQRSSDTEVQGSQKGGVTGSGLGRTHTPYKAINLYRAGTSAQR